MESHFRSNLSVCVSRFGEISGEYDLQVLLAAGFFLFLATLIVNVIANLIVSRTGRIKS